MICENCDGDGHISFMEECNCGDEDCPESSGSAEHWWNHYGFDEYPEAIQTPHGSVVANVMLRELREAMGLSNVALPFTPKEVWEQTLAIVRSDSGHGV